MLLHSLSHWKDRIDSLLWPMAVSYSLLPELSSVAEPTTAITTTVNDTPSFAIKVDGVRRSSWSNKGIFQKTWYIDEASLTLVNNDQHLKGHDSKLHLLSDLSTCMDTGICNISDPQVYAAKLYSAASNTPTFHQAMTGSDASEYIKAMKLEMHSLVQQQTWKSLPCPKDKNVLKGTWAFKLK
jgi:hypothetical protein